MREDGTILGMTWLDSAQALLDVANTPTLSSPVARSFIAPGSVFARDCRLLAVYLDTITAAPLSDAGLPGQGCIVIAQLTFGLVFVADCVPTANDHGAPPAATAVQAWTEDFLADLEAIWGELADAVLSGELGDCDNISIDPAVIEGPSGGIAQVTIPVRVLVL